MGFRKLRWDLIRVLCAENREREKIDRARSTFGLGFTEDCYGGDDVQRSKIFEREIKKERNYPLFFLNMTS